MFMAEVMTALANGVTPGFEGYGWTNSQFWSKAKRTMCAPSFDKLFLEATREITRREPWLTHAEPIRHTVLLNSRNSLDFRHHSNVEPYEECFRGWSQAMLNGSLIYDMGSEGQLHLDHLRKYAVLVLPDSSCLSDEQVEIIRQYVRSGGGLVATFCTSLFDENGKQRPDFALSDVFGASYVSGEDNDYDVRKTHPKFRDQYHYISTDAPHPFFKDVIDQGQRMLCPTPVIRVNAKDSGQGIGHFTIYPKQGLGRHFALGNGIPDESRHPVMVGLCAV